MKRFLLLFIPILLILAGCSTESDPAGIAMNYLVARIEANTDKLRDLSCADWEKEVELQAASFSSIEAHLEDATCKVGGKDGDKTIVECAGKIVYEYNGERNERELGNLLMVQESGEWKVCGEAE